MIYTRTTLGDVITDGMTRAEKEAIVLKALIRFPNPDIVAEKVGSGKAFARKVGDKYGIAHIFFDEIKYDMIRARLENRISPEKIFLELGGHLDAVYRVKDHIQWYGETIRMLAAADRGWKNVDGIREVQPEPKASSKEKAAEGKKPRRNHKAACDALLDLAGVTALRGPKKPAKTPSAKRAAADLESGPA